MSKFSAAVSLLLVIVLWPSARANASEGCDLALKKVMDSETKLDDARGEYQLQHEVGQATYTEPVSNVRSTHHDWANADQKTLSYMKSRSKTPLPGDADAVFAEAIGVVDPSKGKATFWGWSKECGCWYRYQGNMEGGSYTVHWNGMTKPSESAFTFPGPKGTRVAPDQVPWDISKNWIEGLPESVKDLNKAMKGVREATKIHDRVFLEVFGEAPKDSSVFSWEQ